LFIDEDIVTVNQDTPTEISFDAGGDIALLVQPNFTYNWLYIEIDGDIINNVYNTTTYPEIQMEYLIGLQQEGRYLQYELGLIPGSRTLKFKGNGTIDYKIISTWDWDEMKIIYPILKKLKKWSWMIDSTLLKLLYQDTSRWVIDGYFHRRGQNFAFVANSIPNNLHA